jgi:hypothetical protein
VSQGTRKGIKPVRTGRAASSGPAPRIVPGEADIRAVVIRWLHGASREDLSAPMPSPEASEEALQAVRADIAAMTDTEQGWQHASGSLLATLAAHGFAAPPIRLLGFGAELMRAAALERYRLSEQRLSGTLSDVTIANPALAGASPLLAPPPRPVPTKEPVKAEALLAAWAAEAKPARATAKKYGGAFGRLGRAIGSDDVRRWTAEDVVRFKQARLKEGVSAKTVADDVLAAGAVCRWGTANKLLDANPFAGLAPKVTRRGEAPRLPYTDEEARRILTASREETGWLRWGPWLLFATGARIGELADLRRGDVRE